MSVVCTRMSSVCYSYVIRMSLVCTVCHPYVTRLWFYHDFFYRYSKVHWFGNSNLTYFKFALNCGVSLYGKYKSIKHIESSKKNFAIKEKKIFEDEHRIFSSNSSGNKYILCNSQHDSYDFAFLTGFLKCRKNPPSHLFFKDFANQKLFLILFLNFRNSYFQATPPIGSLPTL